MAESYLVGIDGGGSKTAVLVSDLEGNVIGKGMSGPSNYLSEGIEQARQSLQTGIRVALQEAGVESAQISVVCAGLAGVARSSDRQIMEAVLRSIVPSARLVLEFDGVIALAGATTGRPGIIAISGTGSVAFGVNARGERARAGGWGYILGDEGSGYDIARRGLIAVLRAYDGRGPATVLTERISDTLGLNTAEEIIPFLYGNPLSPGRIAALYPVVLNAADEGDPIALGLISDAAGSLAEMIFATADRLEMRSETCLIATAGGVFSGRSVLEEFKRRIHADLPLASMIPVVHPPEYGAILISQAFAQGRDLFKQGSLQR